MKGKKISEHNLKKMLMLQKLNNMNKESNVDDKNMAHLRQAGHDQNL